MPPHCLVPFIIWFFFFLIRVELLSCFLYCLSVFFPSKTKMVRALWPTPALLPLTCCIWDFPSKCRRRRDCLACYQYLTFLFTKFSPVSHHPPTCIKQRMPQYICFFCDNMHIFRGLSRWPSLSPRSGFSTCIVSGRYRPCNFQKLHFAAAISSKVGHTIKLWETDRSEFFFCLSQLISRVQQSPLNARPARHCLSSVPVLKAIPNWSARCNKKHWLMATVCCCKQNPSCYSCFTLFNFLLKSRSTSSRMVRQIAPGVIFQCFRSRQPIRAGFGFYQRWRQDIAYQNLSAALSTRTPGSWTYGHAADLAIKLIFRLLPQADPLPCN